MQFRATPRGNPKRWFGAYADQPISCGAWRKPLGFRRAHPSSESAKPHSQRPWWDVHLTCLKVSYHTNSPGPKDAASYFVKEKNYTNVCSMMLSLSVTLTLRMQTLSSSWNLQGHSTSYRHHLCLKGYRWRNFSAPKHRKRVDDMSFSWAWSKSWRKSSKISSMKQRHLQDHALMKKRSWKHPIVFCTTKPSIGCGSPWTYRDK